MHAALGRNECIRAFVVGNSIMEREKNALGTDWSRVIGRYEQGLKQASQMAESLEATGRTEQRSSQDIVLFD